MSMTVTGAAEAGTQYREHTAVPAPVLSRWSTRVAADVVGIADLAAIVAGAVITEAYHGWQGVLAHGGWLALFEIALLTAGVCRFMLHQLGQYDRKDLTRFPADPARLLLAVLIAYAMVLVVGHSLGVTESLPAAWFPLWLLISALLLLVARRFASARLRHYADQGVFDTSIAIFGAGRVAQELAAYVARKGNGVRLVGIYDDRRDRLAPEDRKDVIGGLADLIEAGRQDRIDEIIIALPQAADQRISAIARKLEHLPVRIRICTHLSSDLIDAMLPRHRVSSLGPAGLLDLKSKPLADWAPLAKRVLDYLLAVPLVILLLPVFAVIAVLIKLDSRGPVLFRQNRHGLNHSIIEVLKFRTMYVMEVGAEVKQAQRGDSRVTRIGRFLRLTSLDELPQLVNVVRGDMSLVGPRPHAIVHNEYYGEMLERYANRHQVKPGITGWAQINGYRGETAEPGDMQKRVEFDLHYIDHWSVWLDLRILLLTPLYGLMHKNAF